MDELMLLDMLMIMCLWCGVGVDLDIVIRCYG